MYNGKGAHKRYFAFPTAEIVRTSSRKCAGILGDWFEESHSSMRFFLVKSLRKKLN